MTEPEAIDSSSVTRRSAVVPPIATPSFSSARDASALPPAAWQDFGAAELQNAPPRGLLAEVMVEGDGAVDLGARQVERLGDQGHGGLRHAAEDLLQSVPGLGGPHPPGAGAAR